MKVKRNVLIVSSVFLLIVVAGLFMFYKPHRSVKDADAEFKLSAAELINIFNEDELKANALYLDKILEVQGTLKDIMFNDSSLVLVLGENTLDVGISCYMMEDQKDHAPTLKKGDAVHVKGICNGMLFDVVLDKCILVQKK